MSDYVLNADSTKVTHLIDHPAADRDPAWSPDGGKVAFYPTRDRNLGGLGDIYVIKADGR